MGSTVQEVAGEHSAALSEFRNLANSATGPYINGASSANHSLRSLGNVGQTFANTRSGGIAGTRIGQSMLNR
jgi:hypothetical protein